MGKQKNPTPYYTTEKITPRPEINEEALRMPLAEYDAKIKSGELTEVDDENFLSLSEFADLHDFCKVEFKLGKILCLGKVKDAYGSKVIIIKQ